MNRGFGLDEILTHRFRHRLHLFSYSCVDRRNTAIGDRLSVQVLHDFSRALPRDKVILIEIHHLCPNASPTYWVGWVTPAGGRFAAVVAVFIQSLFQSLEARLELLDQAHHKIINCLFSLGIYRSYFFSTGLQSLAHGPHYRWRLHDWQ